MTWADFKEAIRGRWFGWILAGHSLVLLSGIPGEWWLMLPFCLVLPAEWLEWLLGLSWLALTVSPLLGLAALKIARLRPAYLLAVIATPLFYLLVVSINASGFASCDGP